MSVHSPEPSASKPVTLLQLAEMRARGEPIAMLTCYDASFARLLDSCGVDCVLVGDSLGMVIQGHASTLPVTVADVEYHVRAVARGLQRAWLIADMPFGSYKYAQSAFDNAVRLMQAGAQMVKVEGGAWLAPRSSSSSRVACRLRASGTHARSRCTRWAATASRARPTRRRTSYCAMRWLCRQPARRCWCSN